jgi:hypothetical protein
VNPHPQFFVEVVRRQRFAVATVIAIVFLAGVNWVQDPHQAQRWLGQMLVLPIALAGVTLWFAWTRRSTGPSDDAPATRRYFRATLTLVVLVVAIRQIAVLGLEIWVRYGDHGADLDLQCRVLGLASAAMFVVVGNTLPKILTPLSLLPLRLAERVSSARRFVGVIWVVLGVVLTIGFVATPLAFAKTLERGAYVAGLLTILGAVVWMNAYPARGES